MFKDFKYEEIPLISDNNHKEKKSSFYTNPVFTFVFSIFSVFILFYFFSSSFSLFPNVNDNFGCGPTASITKLHIANSPGPSDSENSPNFGYEFRMFIENWFVQLLPSMNFPNPRFEGSGDGAGTFKCSNFSESWDELSCLGTITFLSDIINLNNKELHKYILSIIKDPLEAKNSIFSRVSRLGGTHNLSNSLRKNSDLIPPTLVQDFGGGAGAGFQIRCEGILLFTAGGGGGGGFEFSSHDGTHDYQSGGGGGVQIFDPEDNYRKYSIGGGSGWPFYEPKMDDNANTLGFKDAWINVTAAIQNCPLNHLHLHGGGGGAGGITIRKHEPFLWKYYYFYFEFGYKSWSAKTSTNDTYFRTESSIINDQLAVYLPYPWLPIDRG